MVLNLLHTLMPAMDSRFAETAKNFSVALGNTEKVSLICYRRKNSICWHSIVTFWLSIRKLLAGNTACLRPREDSTQFSHIFSVKGQDTQRWGDFVRSKEFIRDKSVCDNKRVI